MSASDVLSESSEKVSSEVPPTPDPVTLLNLNTPTVIINNPPLNAAPPPNNPLSKKLSKILETRLDNDKVCLFAIAHYKNYINIIIIKKIRVFMKFCLV